MILKHFVQLLNISNYTLLYLDEPKNKVKYQLCGDYYIKKNVKLLSYLRYTNKEGQRNTIVKLYKNMELKVARAFQGWGGMA
jgi:uncharacterized beta-barrel protein YwiB (DUF1934 family)